MRSFFLSWTRFPCDTETGDDCRAQAIKDAVGENTGITSAAPRWLSRTISALEAEEVEVNMTKLDAMEQVPPRLSAVSGRAHR
jgi:hypothetical protein